LPITRTELYAIQFDEELPRVGVIVASVFDILNGADMMSGNGDLEDITITPTQIQTLFGNIADSEVIMLAIKTMLVPMLEDPESGISAIVSIPEGVVWEDEVVAIGDIVADIFSADIDFADITGGDTSALLDAASHVSVSDILDSKLVSYTLVNILDGTAGIEGMEFLEIPSGIEWIDEDNDNHGELENILNALHALVGVMTDIDFENIGLNTLNELTTSEIDTIFDSYVITATVSKIITDMDFGDTPIVIPDNTTVIDSQGYIKAAQLKSLITSAKVIAVTVGDETDFSLEAALSLTPAQVSDLLDSSIIAATVGKLVDDMEVSMLEIPSETTESIAVLGETTPVEIVKRSDLEDLINAMTFLGLADYNLITFDSVLLDSFESTTTPRTLDDGKMTILLDSKIILASLTNMVQNMETRSIITFPVEDYAGNPLITTTLGTDYLDTDEAKALFNALFVLDLVTVNSLNMENMITISDNIDIFLDSAILHATISDFILNKTGTSLVIPDYKYGTATPIEVAYADVTYIEPVELAAFVDALSLNLTAFGSISDSWNFDIGSFLAISDLDTLVSSEIMQATISANILPYVKTMAEAPSSSDFIVPAALRQSIDVGGAGSYQIEKTELINLLNSMKMLGLSTFNSTTDPDAIMTIFSDTELTNEFLLSGSIHITLDNMIKSNSNVSGSIPAKALRTEPIYGLSNVLTKTEIIAFINAASAMAEVSGSGDFTNVTFNFVTVLGFSISSPTEQQTIIKSMIVRNVLTPDAVNMATSAGITPPISASDYEDGLVTTFLTEAAMIRIIDYLDLD